MPRIIAFTLAIFMFLSLSLGLAGCGCGTGSDDKAVSPARSLKIGVMFVEDNLPLFLAEAENRFQKEGLAVQLVPFPSAAERDAALQAGQVDGEAADIISACLLKKGGTDVRITNITLGATPQEGRFVLLASPDSRFRTPQDLKHVKIAVSENTIIEYVTDKLLTGTGLKPEEIEKISIPKLPVRLQMLVNNQVKAATLPDPLATLAQKQGAKVILDDTRSDINLSQVVLFFRTESLRSKRQEIAKLIQIFGEAADDLNKHPEQYKDLVFAKAKIPASLKDSYQPPPFSAPQAPYRKEVDDVVNWMVGKKLLAKPYTYEELVDPSLL